MNKILDILKKESIKHDKIEEERLKSPTKRKEVNTTERTERESNKESAVSDDQNLVQQERKKSILNALGNINFK